MKKINIVCPTYRSSRNDKIRVLGVLKLIKSVLNKRNVRLCIIDSSKEPLKIFEKNKNIYGNIIYLHVPNKKSALLKYSSLFPKAMNFCITSKHPKFREILGSVKDWDYFIPWDEGYPISLSLQKQFLSSRPSIGMKRNMAIAALEETFGQSDIICYADDDDFRSENYFSDMEKFIKNNDYVRISKWITCSFQKDGYICGIHNLDLNKDINGNWIPRISTSKKMYNSQFVKSYDLTVKNRYSKLKCLAFPLISYEGAMHVFSTELWRKAVRIFNGIPPVSLAEDVLFFKQCQNYFGNNFHVKLIRNKKFNFLRCAHINTSVVEWTDEVSFLRLPDWAKQSINDVYDLLLSEEKFKIFQSEIKKILMNL